VPDYPGVSSLTEYTIVLYFRRPEIISVNNRPLVSKSAASQRTYTLTSTSSGAIQFVVAATSGDAGSNHITTATGIILRDVWYQVAAVFQGSGATNNDRAKIYVNGLEKAATVVGTITTAQQDTTSAFQIGTTVGTQVDDVRYYSRALSALEIRRLYGNPFADMQAPPLWLFRPAGGGEHDVDITEAVTAAESSDAVVIRLADISEAVAANESSQALLALLAAISEPVTAAETQAATTDMQATITEPVTAGETSEGLRALIATITEAVTAAETSEGETSGLLSASITESVTAAESSSATTDLLAAISEAVSANDSVAATTTLIAAITEAASADATQDGFRAFLADVLEAVTADESSDAIAVSIVEITESVTAGDTQSALLELNAAISEAVTVTDVVTALTVLSASITEAVTLADIVNALLEGEAPGANVLKIMVGMAFADKVTLDIIFGGKL
jgi:hypothetical protein